MDAMIQRLAQELERPAHQVENVVHLIDEGNTIPFIARYRKELHGSMDDQLLRQLAERLQYLRNLEARKEEVRSSIAGQGKLTADWRPPWRPPRRWRRWRTCTAPTSPSAAPGPPSPGRRGWSPWPSCSPPGGRSGGPGGGGPALCGPGEGGGDDAGRPPGGQRHPRGADLRRRGRPQGAASAVSAPGHAGLPGGGRRSRRTASTASTTTSSARWAGSRAIRSWPSTGGSGRAF